MSAAVRPRRTGARDPRLVLAFRVLLAVLIVVAVIIPFTNPPYIVGNVTRIFVATLPVLGLSLLTGFGGLTSIGHNALFGVGAYGTAILTTSYGWPWWLSAPFSMMLVFCAGLLVGFPSSRIKGVFLAVVTLALGAMFPAIVHRLAFLTGGNMGMRVERLRAPEWTGLMSDQWAYFVCLAVLLLCMLAQFRLTRGRFGRALMSIRDQETAAVALGVRVSRTKTLAFGVSAVFAGLGGSLFVLTQGIISSENLYVTLTGSIQFLAALLIGGAGSVLGPLIGTVLAERLPPMLADIDPVLAHVVYGALLIIVILLFKDGIAGALGRFAVWLTRRWDARRRPAPGSGDAPDREDATGREGAPDRADPTPSGSARPHRAEAEAAAQRSHPEPNEQRTKP